MNRRIKIRIATFAIVTLTCGSSFAELTQKQQEAANELISLVSRGSSPAILKAAIGLRQRAKAEQLERIDEYLIENDIPPVTELAAKARFTLVLQGHAKSLPKPSEQETVFSIPIFKQQVDDALTEIQASPLMQTNLPTFESPESYQDVFWDIHVLENKLRNAYQTANYGQRLVNFAKRFKLDDAEKANISADFTEAASTLQKMSRELIERKAELRLDRIQLAGDFLHESEDFRPRLFAARAIDVDGELLIEFLKSRKKEPFSRARLNEPELARVLTDEVEQLREQAGDLIEKSRLFAAGLHWWQRGRYGRGSDGNGMLKPLAAVKSPAAAFGLYMPSEPPKPTDPYEVSGYQVPQNDRRHHDVWRYEYRRIAPPTTTTNTSTFRRPTSKTELSYFW